jgi:HSP20 family protein
LPERAALLCEVAFQGLKSWERRRVMSNVTVQKVPKKENAPTLFESMETLFDDVRKKAFELFQKRGGLDGFDLDDWFRAEQDLVWKPESELTETEKEFQMKVAVPGLEPKDIQISAMPDAIVIQAETTREEEKKEGKVHYSEMRNKKLFRRFEMSGIDVEQVKANLDKGVLEITAPKRALPEVRKIAIAA